MIEPRTANSRLDFAPRLACAASAVAKVLPPITVNGIRYRPSCGSGEAGCASYFGVTAATCSASTGATRKKALSVAPVELKLAVDNPFRSLDFTEEGESLVSG